MENIKQQAINSLRILTLDAVEKAKSGHPGLPFGQAPTTYELWAHHMQHNPKNPNWINRDRFILSAGHGSMLLYSLLHLFEYGLDIEEIKNFRQWGSKTAGHPEAGHTVGVEVTTGPLGAGVSMAVGEALAQAHLAAKFNQPGYEIINHYTYALVGEGCLMEGVAAEALSLAGTLNLDKLIVLYDSNKITIEGHTDIAFRENIHQRMKSYGFNTFVVEDGNNLEEIGKAIEAAKADHSAPSFVEIKTVIGYGMPTQGTSKAHSDAMGAEKAAQTRVNLGWDNTNLFEIPQEVYDHYHQLVLNLEQQEVAWNELKAKYDQQYPQLAAKLAQFYADPSKVVKELMDDEEFWKLGGDKPQATRNVSGLVINYVKDKFENMIGGSADLAPSNKTYMNEAGDFSAEDRTGRNLHFGVRENGMAAVANGIAAHGGFKTYVATFFSFADYMKPMMRLSSLMNQPVVYVLTHDSIGVGEDGPTHQPIEQLSMLRAQPNMHVFRPADSRETVAAWLSALSQTKTPTALALSRQNLEPLALSGKEALKGGYLVVKNADTPDVVLMASGSEVKVMVDAAQALLDQGVKANVLSMPCLELFDEQSAEYKESVLPKSVKVRVAMEAGATMAWYRYVGLDGAVLGLDHFGASSPADRLFVEFGLTSERVVKVVKELL